GAYRQERQFRRQSPADLTKPREIGGVAGVVKRVPTALQHVTSVAPMRVLDHACSPVARRYVGHSQSTMTIAIPPVQFDNTVETEVGDEIEDVMRDHYGGRYTMTPFCLLHNGTQRWPVEVVEVGMGDQDQINSGQVAYLQTRPSKPFKDKQPAREVRIDDNVLACNLEEKTGMADESYTHLPIGYQPGLVSTTSSGSDHGVAHQGPELPGTLAERRILKRIF